MKSDAVFVNTARGPIVVEKDLIRHLRANPQFTAGLDVFENEPALAPGLSELKNCVMCPHIASASMWTRAGMSTLAACNIVGTMRGYPVFKNPSDVRPFVDQTSASRLPKFCPSILNHKDVRSKTRARL
jgi:hydroxypyruvate reductase 1